MRELIKILYFCFRFLFWIIHQKVKIYKFKKIFDLNFSALLKQKLSRQAAVWLNEIDQPTKSLPIVRIALTHHFLNPRPFGTSFFQLNRFRNGDFSPFNQIDWPTNQPLPIVEMALTHHLSNRGTIWNVYTQFQDFQQKAPLHIRICLLNGIDPENWDSERLEILHKLA